jgi:hypothetical protein
MLNPGMAPMMLMLVAAGPVVSFDVRSVKASIATRPLPALINLFMVVEAGAALLLLAYTARFQIAGAEGPRGRRAASRRVGSFGLRAQRVLALYPLSAATPGSVPDTPVVA